MKNEWKCWGSQLVVTMWNPGEKVGLEIHLGGFSVLMVFKELLLVEITKR